MQDVPRESLGAHLGFKGHKLERSEVMDELDEKLGSKFTSCSSKIFRVLMLF